MVLELLSVQEGGKELLEGDFPRSLWIVREAVAKPPLGKAHVVGSNMLKGICEGTKRALSQSAAWSREARFLSQL